MAKSKSKAKPKELSVPMRAGLNSVTELGKRKAKGETKQDTILKLLRRKEGATMEDLQAAVGWQKHTIRGALSRAIGKKLGLKIESAKNEQSIRVYKILGDFNA